jgi:hypothetical protein
MAQEFYQHETVQSLVESNETEITYLEPIKGL